MSWASAYIGRPYDRTLADNCLGLARAIQSEVFDRQLHGLLSMLRLVVSGGSVEDQFPELARPVEGCIVLMGTRQEPAAHVGVWCESARRVVHASRGFGSVVAEELSTLRMQWHSVRFFEVPA